MKIKVEVTKRNLVNKAMCTDRQFRNKVHVNKKKVIKKFNLNKELRNYKGSIGAFSIAMHV